MMLSMIFLTELTGIAKPRLSDVEVTILALVMPITAPKELMSGPPLLPGLMAASVWMMLTK